MGRGGSVSVRDSIVGKTAVWYRTVLSLWYSYYSCRYTTWLTLPVLVRAAGNMNPWSTRTRTLRLHLPRTRTSTSTFHSTRTHHNYSTSWYEYRVLLKASSASFKASTIALQDEYRTAHVQIRCLQDLEVEQKRTKYKIYGTVQIQMRCGSYPQTYIPDKFEYPTWATQLAALYRCLF